MEKTIVDQKSLECIGFTKPPLLTIDGKAGSVGINSVFGVNDRGVLPARFLSAFVPAFQLANHIGEKSAGIITPEVRVFMPIEISKSLNGTPTAAVERIVNQGVPLLTALAKQEFPNVSWHIDKDKRVTPEVLDLLDHFATVIEQVAPEKIVKNLRERGKNRGGELGEQNALRYGGHHFFGWETAGHPDIFPDMPPVTVINTTPPSEADFTTIRHALRQHFEINPNGIVCKGNQFDLVIDMCKTPHYLVITDQEGNLAEPTLDDLLTTNCGEISAMLQERSEHETDGRRKALQKANEDFDRFILWLAKRRGVDVFDANFGELLKS